MSDPGLRGEVEKIKAHYAAYDAAGSWQTTWAPFNPGEAAYRARQMVVMAQLLRGIGKNDLAGWRILDVGCGRGRQLRSFLDMGAQPADLYGTDIHAGYLQDAKARVPALGYVLTDGVDLPLADAQFDFVTEFVVLSSVPSHSLRSRVAQEMWRVLKPGGYVWLWELRGLAPAAGTEAHIDYASLFPPAPHSVCHTAMVPPPSETLRPFRGARWLGRVFDLLKKPPTHLGLLIGPK